MLGLGDIVIPGILVALMLRLDDHVSPSLRWLEHKTCNMFETPSNQINFATRLADQLSYLKLKFTRVSKLRNEIHLIPEFQITCKMIDLPFYEIAGFTPEPNQF